MRQRCGPRRKCLKLRQASRPVDRARTCRTFTHAGHSLSTALSCVFVEEKRRCCAACCVMEWLSIAFVQNAFDDATNETSDQVHEHIHIDGRLPRKSCKVAAAGGQWICHVLKKSESGPAPTSYRSSQEVTCALLGQSAGQMGSPATWRRRAASVHLLMLDVWQSAQVGRRTHRSGAPLVARRDAGCRPILIQEQRPSQA